MAKTKNALTILDRITGDDPKLSERIEEEIVMAGYDGNVCTQEN